jgi:hypothetical protein
MQTVGKACWFSVVSSWKEHAMSYIEMIDRIELCEYKIDKLVSKYSKGQDIVQISIRNWRQERDQLQQNLEADLQDLYERTYGEEAGSLF